MELIIHGTKGGYRLFDNSKTSYTTTGDIRDYLSNSNGKSLYTLNFKKEGVSISKITIIEDLGRGAFGFLAVTLFLPKEEKLAGKDIHELLNNSTSHYLNTYTNRLELAEDTREDWPQFNQIKNEYTSRLTPISPHDQRHFEPSSNTKKYLFYKNNIELETIFDYPFYPEFNESKIIFLVDGTYEGNHDCPLNLSHSDIAKGNLTNSIDLENPEYKLKTLPTNIQVFINNDGAPRNLFSGDTIRKQDPLRIIWRREFHNDKQLDSTIADILKDLNNSKYNHVKIYNRDLTIYSRDDFDQREEKIKINTNKSDVSFSLEYNGDHINSDNNEYKFIGDEIGRKWKVEIHTPHFKANPDSIQPSDFSGSSRYISFNEFREYKNFDVRDESGNPIYDFEIKINGINYNINKPIWLAEKDLKNKCFFNVSAIGYNNCSGNFNPKDTFAFPPITLVTATSLIGDTKDPKLGSGAGGTVLAGTGAKVAKAGQPGGRDSDPKPKSDLEILKPNKKTILVLVGITLLLGIGLLVYKVLPAMTDKGKKTTTHLTPQNILDYCKGDTLKLNELKIYQQNYCEPQSENSNKGGLFDWFSTRKTDDTPEEDRNCNTVDLAIKFREALNNGDIDFLLDTLNTLGHVELNTKIVEIKNIDSIKDKVSQSMKFSKVSEMTISEIVTQLTTLESILIFNEAKADVTIVDVKIVETKQLELIDSTLRLDILNKLESRKQMLTKGSDSNNNPESKPPSKDADQPNSENNQTKEVQTPKVQTPKVQTPKAQAPKAQAPKVQTPKVQTPKAQAPKAQAPKAQTPKAQAPKVQTPKAPTNNAPTKNKNTTAVGEQRK